MTNTNCLEGFKCPECGQDESFFIGIQTLIRLYDDGSEDVPTDTEYNDSNYCRCTNCDYESTVGVFRGIAPAGLGSEPRHSKAPWLPGHKSGDVEPVVSGGVVIAEMIPTDCTEEEFQANCSLVYASPKLLRALKGCFEALQSGMTDEERNAVFGNGYGIYQLMEEAENAIAEAEAAA